MPFCKGIHFRLLVFSLLTGFVQAAQSGLTGADPHVVQIPSWPQHGAALGVRAQGLGNISVAGQQSATAVYAQPAALVSATIKDEAAVTMSVMDAEPVMQPGVAGVARSNGRQGWGVVLLTQRVKQTSPLFDYRDEYGGTGLAASNYQFTDTRVLGSRNILMAGGGHAVTEAFSLGVAAGLIFGDLNKTATLTQYDSDTFNTALGNYTQTDSKQYRAMAMVFSGLWRPSSRLELGVRFMTPVANAATVQSTVRDNSNTVIYQDARPYTIENHVMGADAEAGFGLVWNGMNGTSTSLAFEYHDNVYFGSSASWENQEIRFGHEWRSAGRIFRVGGHWGVPFIDGGTAKITGDINRQAASLGLTAGMGIPLSGSSQRQIDSALSLRRAGFDTEDFSVITLSAGLTGDWL